LLLALRNSNARRTSGYETAGRDEAKLCERDVDEPGSAMDTKMRGHQNSHDDADPDAEAHQQFADTTHLNTPSYFLIRTDTRCSLTYGASAAARRANLTPLTRIQPRRQQKRWLLTPENTVQVERDGDYQIKNSDPFRESEHERECVGNRPATASGLTHGCVPEGSEPGDRVGLEDHSEQAYRDYRESQNGQESDYQNADYWTPRRKGGGRLTRGVKLQSTPQ
jgi:hypothetical protein